MSSFLHPALFWTLGLPTLGVVALPVLIHLINMMRHRRLEWAAMEFLLVSQKKHRTWVILKQLLLLLLRMAAVAAIVLMVAQPRLHSQVTDLLGGTRTHHIVLLDDSYSMSDRWADTDAFSQAKKVVDRIGANAVKQDRLQWFTLLRFSRAGRPQRRTEPDMIKEPVSSKFGEKLSALLWSHDRKAKLEVTQLACGPLPALQAVAKFLGGGEGEHRVLYLISDFRARQWNNPTDIHQALLQLSGDGVEIHLIDCVDRVRPNLAIVSLAPAEGLRAAGVPLVMNVTVRNFGPAPVRNVSVALSEDGHARAAVRLAEIPAGKTASESFPVQFANAGSHRITARLEADAVAADNERYCAIDVPAEAAVLLVDGDVHPRNARYLSIALAPGESVRTGLRPQIETPSYLATKPLGDFGAINLANVERLDASAVKALEKYVENGGGVAFFLGDRCDVKFFNDVLYRNGKGLFPVPLERQAELEVDRLEPAPDLEADEHYIFDRFKGKRNSYLQTVTVQRYFAVSKGWRPSAKSGVRVAAHLRNGAPLVVERSFGKGRAMAFLTTAAPTWNNWAGNPGFVVVMQDLEAYLTQRAGDESRLVGSPLALRLDAKLYRPEVQFALPEQAVARSVPVNAVLGTDGVLTASFFDTDQSGFYEAQLVRSDNLVETRRYAVNVDPNEGDLAAIDAQRLAPRLEGVKYQFEQAKAFQTTSSELAGYNLGEAILYMLVLLLIGEQILAWSASYHPRRLASPQAQGGAA
ncbi:MAG: BatA domain-containing protein [Thermoguttaceae bacterium]|jgi:hypothetical protein